MSESLCECLLLANAFASKNANFQNSDTWNTFLWHLFYKGTNHHTMRISFRTWKIRLKKHECYRWKQLYVLCLSSSAFGNPKIPAPLKNLNTRKFEFVTKILTGWNRIFPKHGFVLVDSSGVRGSSWTPKTTWKTWNTKLLSTIRVFL